MWKYVAGAVFTGCLMYGVKKYFNGGSCHCKTRLDGLVVIVTGATSGIGKSLVYQLANKGATVILACRDIKKGELVKETVIEKTGNSDVIVLQLDLNSFESIIKFSEFINEHFTEIYALVNNAGVFHHPQQLTPDNFDVTLQTNYLGPFVLTHHLLKGLKKSDDARIVNIVSNAHRHVNRYDLKAITTCQSEFRSHFKAYGVSKLGLLLFTRVFARKLSGTNIVVNAVNPGNVETNIFRNYTPLSNPWLYALQWGIRIFVIKSPHQGAQTVLHLLLTPEKQTGNYLVDCKTAVPGATALDDELAEQYYSLTLEILTEVFVTESEC